MKLGKNNLIYICFLRVVGSLIQLYFVKHQYCHAMHWARTKGGNRRHLILMLWSIESRQGFEELRNPQNLQYRYMIQLLMRSCCLHNDKKKYACVFKQMTILVFSIDIELRLFS